MPRLWPWAGRLSSPPQGLSGPSGRLQMAAELQEQEESKPEALLLFSLPLALPVVKASPTLNPDASGKWEKGLPLFTGGADSCGHFIICSFGFFCKLLRNYPTNPIPYHTQDASTVCGHFLNSPKHSIFSVTLYEYLSDQNQIFLPECQGPSPIVHFSLFFMPQDIRDYLYVIGIFYNYQWVN